MVDLARKNATKRGLKPPHVAFVQASLVEPLPIESDSVDCVLSNCVVNLLPFQGKAHVLREVNRILKLGGRLVLGDVRSFVLIMSCAYSSVTLTQILAKKILPDRIKNDLAAYVGCIAGSVTEDEYKNLLADAGFPSKGHSYFEAFSYLRVSLQTPSSCITRAISMHTSKGIEMRILQSAAHLLRQE